MLLIRVFRRPDFEYEDNKDNVIPVSYILVRAARLELRGSRIRKPEEHSTGDGRCTGSTLHQSFMVVYSGRNGHQKQNIRAGD